MPYLTKMENKSIEFKNEDNAWQSIMHRLFIYILMTERDFINFESVKYFFSNLNAQESIDLIMLDSKKRFSFFTEKDQNFVGLNLPPSPQDAQILQMVQFWRNKIYNFVLPNRSGVLLSVLGSQFPRPYEISIHVKVKDILLSDKANRFHLYETPRGTSVILKNASTNYQVKDNELSLEVRDLKNKWCERVVELLLPEKSKKPISLITSLAPFPYELELVHVTPVEVLLSDQFRRFSISRDDHLEGRSESVLVYLLHHETEEIIKSLCEKWRNKVYSFLLRSSHPVDISDLGSLVPRPPRLPSAIRLKQTLLNDPLKRFKLIPLTNPLTSLVSILSPGVAGSGTGTCDDDGDGAGNGEGEGEGEGGRDAGWTTVMRRAQGKAATEQMWRAPYPPMPPPPPPMPPPPRKVRGWDQKDVSHLQQAAALRDMLPAERNGPEGVALQRYLSVARAAAQRCRLQGLTNKDIRRSLAACSTVPDLQLLYPIAASSAAPLPAEGLALTDSDAGEEGGLEQVPEDGLDVDEGGLEVLDEELDLGVDREGLEAPGEGHDRLISHQPPPGFQIGPPEPLLEVPSFNFSLSPFIGLPRLPHPVAPRPAQPASRFTPSSRLEDFCEAVFDGFPAEVWRAFVERFSAEGYIAVQDLLNLQADGGLSYDSVHSLAGLRTGHYHRLRVALLEMDAEAQAAKK